MMDSFLIACELSSTTISLAFMTTDISLYVHDRMYYIYQNDKEFLTWYPSGLKTVVEFSSKPHVIQHSIRESDLVSPYLFFP